MLLVYEPVLQHHGVKGMRWGHRRYRNRDGSLTNEGKKRYSDKEIAKVNENLKKSNQAALDYFDKNVDKLFDLETFKKYDYDPELYGTDIKKAFKKYKKEAKNDGYKDTSKDLYSIDDNYRKLIDEANKWNKEHDDILRQQWDDYYKEKKKTRNCKWPETNSGCISNFRSIDHCLRCNRKCNRKTDLKSRRKFQNE